MDFSKLDLQRIYSFIDNDVLFIGDTQKRFYKHIITERFIKIIKESYDRLIGAKE